VDHLSDLDRRIAAIAALDQPLRRELFRVLASSPGWTTRDAAAAAVGVPRSVAAFHLDKLADAGVLDVRFERTTGRRGPGAGRPSKLYRPSQDETAASLPERRYDLAGSLLAAAVAESTRSGTPVGECLRAAARSAGVRMGEEAQEAVDEAGSDHDRRAAVIEVLGRHGYEPVLGVDEEIALANCPFHRLAVEHRELVCGMNLDFLGGLLEGLQSEDRLTARLEPAPGYCCVRIAAA
jgi:predicted ArsR family transcriptional regulator